MPHTNNFPKLHNAAWPGVVGKGSPGAEPLIELDTMLDYTAAAEVDGVAVEAGERIFRVVGCVAATGDGDGDEAVFFFGG